MADFETIRKQVQAARDARHPLADELDYMVDAARVNADDTVYLEKAAPADEWSRIALGSLQDLCAFSRNSDAVAWFLAQGVTF